jgi:hypothetical protein
MSNIPHNGFNTLSYVFNEGGYHNVVSQTEITFSISNSIYFALRERRQEYRNDKFYFSKLYLNLNKLFKLN